MKINSIPPSEKVESYKSRTVQPIPRTERTMESDRVEFSEGARSFASVIKSVKDKLDTRTEAERSHIKEVEKQIADGTYKVDSSEVAAKILGGRFNGRA